MLDSKNSHPAPFSLPRPGAVARQLRVECVNLSLACAVLSDGSTVPITHGWRFDGSECELDDDELAAFVCGRPGVWFDCLMKDFRFDSARPH